MRAAGNPALAQTLKAEYDYNLGAMTKFTDVNGVDTTFAYLDPLYRLTLAIQAAGKSEAFQTKFQYCDDSGSACGSRPALSVRTSITRTTDVFSDVSDTLFDGLGRGKESRQFVPGGYNATCTTYDGLGRQLSASNPKLNACATATDQLTINTYDALSRVTDVTHPDGSNVHTDYAGNVTTVTDEAGKKRQSTTDALGRLTQVVEDPDGLGYFTSYTYDALDNLLTVSQSGQNRSFAYDALSRLICASNPESRVGATSCAGATPGPPVSGVDWFTYDNNGNLKTKTDARGTLTTNTYDDLNRVELTEYTAGAPTVATPSASFNYHTTTGDAPCFNKGQLQSVVNAVSTNSYPCYDALGRATQSSQITDGTTYSFNYTYNADSTLKTQSYPGGGLTVAYDYDSAGRPTKAGRDTVGQTDFTQSITYKPHGAPDQFKLGNGLIETTSYNNRLQPTKIQAGSLLTLDFGYGGTNNNGNILSQAITRNAAAVGTQHYRYDPLKRLAIATEGTAPTADDNCPSATWCRDYGYDALGNRAVIGTFGLTLPVATPTSLNEYLDLDNLANPPTTRIFAGSHDSAGNLTALANLAGTMSYDAINKMTAFDNGDGANPKTGQYFYDGAGNRVKRVTGDSGAFETVTYAYDAFGKLAAEYSSKLPAEPAGTLFRTTDHLGSTRLVTNAGQAIHTQGCRDFFPFGERIGKDVGGRSGSCYGGEDKNDALSQKFTGKERDVESDLDYFLARYYSPKLGRFMSVDPNNADAGLENPQSWNGYSYTRNNPSILVDPDGRFVVSGAALLKAGAEGGISAGIEVGFQFAEHKLRGGSTADFEIDRLSVIKEAAIGSASFGLARSIRGANRFRQAGRVASTALADGLVTFVAEGVAGERDLQTLAAAAAFAGLGGGLGEFGKEKIQDALSGISSEQASAIVKEFSAELDKGAKQLLGPLARRGGKAVGKAIEKSTRKAIEAFIRSLEEIVEEKQRTEEQE